MEISQKKSFNKLTNKEHRIDYIIGKLSVALVYSVIILLLVFGFIFVFLVSIFLAWVALRLVV